MSYNYHAVVCFAWNSVFAALKTAPGRQKKHKIKNELKCEFPWNKCLVVTETYVEILFHSIAFLLRLSSSLAVAFFHVVFFVLFVGFGDAGPPTLH